jgi:hypothetical protein
MRRSVIQVTKEAALKYIDGGERAAIDYIPKIKDRVMSSEFSRSSKGDRPSSRDDNTYRGHA